MAQVIAILCDQCLVETDREVSGQTYRLGVELPGERWHWVTVDLCGDHSTGVSDLALTLDKYGRTFTPDDSTRVSGSFGARVCPDCGKTYTSKSGYQTHRRNIHPDRAEAESTDGFVCEVADCGRSFPKLQGYRMHQFRSHGIRVS